jgi:hypothetical protein
MRERAIPEEKKVLKEETKESELERTDELLKELTKANGRRPIRAWKSHRLPTLTEAMKTKPD